MSQTKPDKPVAYAVISIVIGIVIALLLLEAGLVFYQNHVRDRETMTPGFILYDDILGWKLARSWSGHHERSEFRVSYRTDTSGFRASSFTPDRDDIRWAVLGDSFTFGLGVDDSQTFIEVMNQTVDSSYFQNFAIPGYSTDQEWLLYQQQPMIRKSDRLLLVVYLANDLFDNTLAFPLQAQHAKPYATLRNGELLIENQPVPLISKPAGQQQHDHTHLNAPRQNPTVWQRLSGATELGALLSGFLFAEQYDISDVSAYFKNEINIMEALLTAIASDAVHQQPVIALMPGRSFVERDGSYAATYQDYFRLELLRIGQALDLTVIDLASSLRETHTSGTNGLFYPVDGHLTPAGHQTVAAILLESLY